MCSSDLFSGKILPDGTISEKVLDGTISSVLGIQTLEMGVFGGIVVGLGVAFLHNRFYKTKLPAAISFFSGVRFVPIICTFAYIVVGFISFAIWPVIQQGIFSIGRVVTGSGDTGAAGAGPHLRGDAAGRHGGAHAAGAATGCSVRRGGCCAPRWTGTLHTPAGRR